MAVEVAIRALRQAKRPVDVDAELIGEWFSKTGLRELDKGARPMREAISDRQQAMFFVA